MKIKLIRRVPTTKAEYFESIGISRRFFFLTRRSFPTIFRQLPTNESIPKAAPPWFDPTTFRVTIYYSTTAPHSLYVNLCDSSFPCSYMFTFVSTVFSFVSTVLTFVSTVFSFLYSVHLRQNCVFLLQYCVNLRHTVFFFVSTVFFIVRSLFTFVSTLFFFLSMVLNFVSICFLCQYPVHLRQYCVFLRQYCVYLRQYCVFSWTQCWIFQQSIGARNRVEIVFVNVYEAQDSIPRNQFRQAGNWFPGF